MPRTKHKGLCNIALILVAVLMTSINIDAFENEPICGVYHIDSTEIYGFDDFQILADDSILLSSKTSSDLTFSYNGGSTNIDAMDSYLLTLPSGNWSDFMVETNFVYNYSGGFLGEFYFALFSDYAEDGSIAVGENQQTITDTFIIGFESDPTAGLTGHPNDGFDQHVTPYGSLDNQGVLVFRIGRIAGSVLCEIENTPDFTLGHSWSSGLTKPLNSIKITGYIFPLNSSYIDVAFDYFYANLTPADNPTTTPGTPTTTTPSNNYNGTLPIWAWAAIGGGFVLIIGFFIVLDVIMRKRTA